MFIFTAYIPAEISCLLRKVKKSNEGTFFHFGGQRNYFEVKKITTGDEIRVLPLTDCSSDEKVYLFSKDGQIWHSCIWKSKRAD